MKVLLGFGGSSAGLAALEREIRRARETGDELTVAVLDTSDVDATPEELAARARSVLSDGGLEAGVVTLDGDPGPALVELAEAEGFEELALAGGHETPLGKIRLGPVVEFVVRHASMTVRLVR